ncbi:hypothetical protein PROFUN_07071 [Planoprotostelium fungivorum]|uniref:Uncharacterized protein n=1 Tax=Planoprotostelium fungivorum TaxID=1890364 RepID=A0A2P6NN12_9EUKA|nr:hypothetical protein PROFUN_07071 [Planoprotostelium fungivorum]
MFHEVNHEIHVYCTIPYSKIESLGSPLKSERFQEIVWEGHSGFIHFAQSFVKIAMDEALTKSMQRPGRPPVLHSFAHRYLKDIIRQTTSEVVDVHLCKGYWTTGCTLIAKDLGA